VRAYHPRDPSWGEVREHRWITVCDWNIDGHAVYVRYYEDMPQFANIAFRAGYAPSQGCDTWLSAYGFSINRWVVCVQYEGCSAMYGPHGKCRVPSDIGCN
jgi:hypothetical protein